MAPIISPGRAWRLEAAHRVAKEPSLLPSLELPAVLAGVGQQAVTHRAQGHEPAAPGLIVVRGALQDRHGEDARDGSRAEATTEHANTLCLATHMSERELALERAKAASGIATRGAGRGLRYLPSLRGPGGLLPAASAGLG